MKTFFSYSPSPLPLGSLFLLPKKNKVSKARFSAIFLQSLTFQRVKEKATKRGEKGEGDGKEFSRNNDEEDI